MAETVSAVSYLSPSQCLNLFLHKAVKFIEQGHIRVGPDTITDPAFLVTRLVQYGCRYSYLLKQCFGRHMEDYVTWVDTSKVKRTVMQYNDEVRFYFLFCDLDQS
jgi:hypothetical protein